MHTVVEINVGRTGPITFYKGAGAGSGEGMCSLVVLRQVGFCFNHNASAAAPHQSCPDQTRSTDQRIALKKVGTDQLFFAESLGSGVVKRQRNFTAGRLAVSKGRDELRAI